MLPPPLGITSRLGALDGKTPAGVGARGLAGWHPCAASCALLTVLLIGSIAHGATIRVPADVPTIQGAIAAAVNGDSIVVAAGTYTENLDFLGKAIAVASQDGPATTIIDGHAADTVV